MLLERARERDVDNIDVNELEQTLHERLTEDAEDGDFIVSMKEVHSQRWIVSGDDADSPEEAARQLTEGNAEVSGLTEYEYTLDDQELEVAEVGEDSFLSNRFDISNL